MSCDKVANNVFFDNTYMYLLSLITGVFLTYCNTTPTITIFVSLLFDKAVSMMKHIMEIVKGNTEFIKAGQTPRTWRVSLNIWGPFFCTLLDKNWVHEDD